MTYKTHWIKTDYTKHDELLEQFLFFIIHHSVLTLEGVKPASLVVFKDTSIKMKILWNRYCKFITFYMDISFKVLQETDDKVVVLFYKESLLESVLDDPLNQKFLKHFAYKSFDLRSALNKLEKRFFEICPHEIGIFLGYPVDDVKCFSNCSKRKCLATGYWKVYDNVSEALNLFSKFDSVRNKYASLMHNGMLPSELSMTYFN